MLRLAEMYLILAEAVGPTAEGLEAINKVRRRAFGLPIDTASAARPDRRPARHDLQRQPCCASASYELAFEDDRWFDLKRTGELLTNPHYRPRACKPFNMVLPIPQSELDVNPGLTQNPGY